MSIQLKREYTNQAQNSNTISGAIPQSSYKFYKTTYTTTGAKDWIYLPDAIFTVGVSLTFAGGTATIEVTDDPPDVIEGGSPAAITWPLGAVSASTSTTLQGYTAFRVNVSVANVTLSVRS